MTPLPVPTLKAARELKAARMWFNEDRNLDAVSKAIDNAIDSLEAEDAKHKEWAKRLKEGADSTDYHNKVGSSFVTTCYDKAIVQEVIAELEGAPTREATTSKEKLTVLSTSVFEVRPRRGGGE